MLAARMIGVKLTLVIEMHWSTCITSLEGSHQAIILLKLRPKPSGKDNSPGLLRNCESRYRR